MTWQQILTLVVAVGTPLSGIVVALVANTRSRRHVTREQVLATAGVKIDEKDAHTREIAVILDGYTAVNQAQLRALERAEASADNCNKRYDTLETKYDLLVQRFEVAEEQNEERVRVLVQHVVALEAMVPTPPGPPERPAWFANERNGT